MWPLDDRGPCDANDRSVVLWVEYAGRGLMLAADIEAAAERGVLRR
ncbi:MAG: hypothetical protein VB852_01735 [Deltaproteobacteria bacterium]